MKLKYPWPEMAVGDIRILRDGKLSSIRSAADTYNKRHNTDYIVGRADGGIRVWRRKDKK